MISEMLFLHYKKLPVMSLYDIKSFQGGVLSWVKEY